jgi:hypothetical protein
MMRQGLTEPECPALGVWGADALPGKNVSVKFEASTQFPHPFQGEIALWLRPCRVRRLR